MDFTQDVGDDADVLREIHLLGKWATQESITSPDQLAAAADPEIRERWKRTLLHHPWPPEHAIRVLKIWAQTPHPVVAFPMLSQISFEDESTFGGLAAKFLGE